MMTYHDLCSILTLVTFPGYTWKVRSVGDRFWFQGVFTAPDCRTDEPAEQFTRKWYISQESTRSEVVQTALKCVLTSVEHEARENFRYRGFAIFGPHHDVEQLVQIKQDER